MYNNYDSISFPACEGDDVCGIFATQSLNKDAVVILSGDKDLRTIPGIHHFIHDESTEVVNEKSADYNWMYQTLTGDMTDGFGGCPRSWWCQSIKNISKQKRFTRNVGSCCC